MEKKSLANGFCLHHVNWLDGPFGQLSPPQPPSSSSFSPPLPLLLCPGERVPFINAIPGDVFTQGRKLNINIPRRRVSCHFCEALQAGRVQPPKSAGTYAL